MASSATINSLVTKVRTRGDVVGSASFDDAVELKPWIRDSLLQLHEILVQRHKDYYVSTAAYSLSAGQDCYALPHNFRLLQDCFVFSRAGATRSKVQSFNSEDFTTGPQSSVSGSLRYRVMRNSLYIMPTPSVDVHNALLIRYTPSFRSPYLDWTSIDDVMPSGWEEWIVLDVLQKMNGKVRLLNNDDLLKSKVMLEGRLLAGLVHRDSEPPMMKVRSSYQGAALPTSQGAGPTYWVDI